MKILTLVLISIALIIPNVSIAHPGRTDASGCHTCRTNCSSWGLSTGEYHCHRSKGVTQPIEPIKSIRNENGVGKTVPAPEYKVPATTVKTPTIDTTSKVNTVAPASTVKTSTINTTATPSAQTQKKSWISRFFSWVF